MKKYLVIFIVLIILIPICKIHAVGITLRLGQGGLIDKRAPDGKLGGGQLALDIKLDKVPIAFSISSEYHTKGPDPTAPYEIGGLVAVNALYLVPLFKNKVDIYLGGGLGGLYVPKIDNHDEVERGILLNSAAGMNFKAFWKVGFYVEGKYIYASKTVNDIKVIDFSDFGFMVGISFNFK